MKCAEDFNDVQCQAVLGGIHQFSESLGLAIDAKDHFTRLHSEEVAVVSQMLALAMGIPPGAADHIHIAGHLHDIGKIGIPDQILQKPGPLEPHEWTQIKQHPVIGAKIIAPVRFLAANGIAKMVYHHHEAYNGNGYPDGLAGKQIPLGARIIAAADSLSAMLQNRPYRPGRIFPDALGELAAQAGERYDPEVIRVLLLNANNIELTLQSLNDVNKAEDCLSPTGVSGYGVVNPA